MENNEDMRDIRRVIKLRLQRGNVYLTEPTYRTLHRVVTQPDGTSTLYFDNKLNLSVDPEIVDWVDVADLSEIGCGVFYDPERFGISDYVGASWMKTNIMITFVPSAKYKPEY